MNRFALGPWIESLESRRPSPMWPHSVHLLKQVHRWFPNCVPVAVVGSAGYEHDESGRMQGACQSLGRRLSQCPEVCLLTGGMPAVGQDVGAAFAGDQPFRAPLIHVLPIHHGPVSLPETGRVLEMGNTFDQRQEILALSASIMIVIGGGPGTAREANLALGYGTVVLPVVGTGGAAAGTRFDIDDPIRERLKLDDFKRYALEAHVDKVDWDSLASPDTELETSTEVVCAIIRKLIAS